MYTIAGCASAPDLSRERFEVSTGESAKSDAGTYNETMERMLVWNAYLTIETGDVKIGLEKSKEIVKKYGGYMESSSGRDESTGSIVMKIPTSSFHEAIKAVQGIGKATNTRITSQDVTEQFVDVQARLKSKVELRERLRKLLDKANDIKDVITIETELTRIQGEIEAMEATVKRLQSQVDYGTINVSFERKTILGPVALVFNGIWWGFKKLFVISD